MFFDREFRNDLLLLINVENNPNENESESDELVSRVQSLFKYLRTEKYVHTSSESNNQIYP